MMGMFNNIRIIHNLLQVIILSRITKTATKFKGKTTPKIWIENWTLSKQITLKWFKSLIKQLRIMMFRTTSLILRPMTWKEKSRI